MLQITFMGKNIIIPLVLLLFQEFAISQPIAKAQTTITTKICPREIQLAVDNITDSPEFSRVRWGILVKNLVSQQTLYQQDAEKYFHPASNTKILTTAAALQELGSNFRIRTSIYQDGDGVLRVVGRGDPSIKFPQLQELAQQLRQQGISQIKELIADDSYFQGEFIPPSWEWEDLQASYGAPVNSLIFNENASIFKVSPQAVGKPLQVKWNELFDAYQWRVENNSVTTQENQSDFLRINRSLGGPILRVEGGMAVNSRPNIFAVAVVDPTTNFLGHFRQALLIAGISVEEMSQGGGEGNQRELAAVESLPLSELLKETNSNSNNLYAEALLRILANKKTIKNTQSTAAVGLEVLKNALTRLGVEPESYILVDGSGLSRKNLISPQALVQTLAEIGRSPLGKVFRNSLPIAGVNGTLKYRLGNTPAAGIVRAKTGTMTGVVSLSGYINPPSYEPLAFSIIVNHSGEPPKVVRESVDKIVILLSQLRRC